MQRRTLLRSIAAGGLGAALTGCLSGATPSSDGETTAPSEQDAASPTPTDHHTDTRPEGKQTTGEGTTSPSDEEGTSSPKQTDGSSWDPDAQKPFEIVEVGSRDGVSFPDNNRPHEVAVLNELDRTREIHVSIADGATEELDASRTFAFPAGGWVLFRLNVPSQYDVSFETAGTTLGSVTVGQQWFDCNGSRSRFGLTAEGVTDYGERTTLMACPDADVAGTDLTVTDRKCASEDAAEAAIGFGGESVTVDGTILTATPCRELSIETATDDGDRDRLTVVVGASPSDGVCQQCLGAVEYEASIAFEHDLPTTVVLEHRSRNGSRTVKTTARGKNA